MPEAAESGLTALQECGDGEGEFGWSIAGDWVVLAETDEIAEDVTDATAEASLSDDDEFQRWTGEAGDPGILTAYVAPEAGDLLAEAFAGFGSFGAFGGGVADDCLLPPSDPFAEEPSTDDPFTDGPVRRRPVRLVRRRGDVRARWRPAQRHVRRLRGRCADDQVRRRRSRGRDRHRCRRGDRGSPAEPGRRRRRRHPPRGHRGGARARTPGGVVRLGERLRRRLPR